MASYIQYIVGIFILISTITVCILTGNLILQSNENHTLNTFSNLNESNNTNIPFLNFTQLQLDVRQNIQSEPGSIYNDRLNHNKTNHPMLPMKKKRSDVNNPIAVPTNQPTADTHESLNNERFLSIDNENAYTTQNRIFKKEHALPTHSDNELNDPINRQFQIGYDHDVVKIWNMFYHFFNQREKSLYEEKSTEIINDPMLRNDASYNNKKNQMPSQNLINLSNNLKNKEPKLLTAEFDNLVYNFVVRDLVDIVNITKESQDFNLKAMENSFFSYKILDHRRDGRDLFFVNQMNRYIYYFEYGLFEYSQFALQHKPDILLNLAKNALYIIKIANNRNHVNRIPQIIAHDENYQICDVFTNIYDEFVLFKTLYTIKPEFYKQYAYDLIKIIYLKNLCKEFTCLDKKKINNCAMINKTKTIREHILFDLQKIDKNAMMKQATIVFQHFTIIGLEVIEYFGFLDQNERKILMGLIQNSPKNDNKKPQKEYFINFTFDKKVPIALSFLTSKGNNIK